MMSRRASVSVRLPSLVLQSRYADASLSFSLSPLHAGPLEEELRELRKSQASRGRAHESAVAKWNAAEAKLKQCRNLATDTEEKLVGGEAPSHSYSHRIQLMEPTVFHDSRKPRLWIW